MADEKRSGIASLLAFLRAVFDNPAIRLALYASIRDVECYYGSKIVKNSILYHALSLYAGVDVYCPLSVRFMEFFIKQLTKLSLSVMKGREEDLIKALKDPALRRGIASVIKGLALYGVTVPQKLAAPFLIVWNFTNMCNLRCKHCYQRADRPTKDELDLKEKLAVVAQLDKAGVAAIALSGGEPTIHPHFLTIVKAIADRGIYAAVATNGWKFADMNYLLKAKEAGLRYVEVSIDSANPKKHDEFRGVRGSWERAVKALENAVKIGLNHAMAVTITKYNLSEVEDLLDLAQSIGVRRVAFFNFIPVGRGADVKELDLDPIERERFMRDIYSEMKKRGIEVITTAPEYGRVVLQASGNREVSPTHFYTGGDRITKALAEYVGGCGAGRIYAAIQPNGDVTPCVFLPIKLGNLREKPFWRIWNENELLRRLRNRDNLKGFCRTCPYRNVCGGCRAKAYAYLGDPLGPDPGCIYNARYWRRVVEERMMAPALSS